jgi:hypothetical protein
MTAPARKRRAGPIRPVDPNRPKRKATSTKAPNWTPETAREAAMRGVEKRRQAAADRKAAELAMYELVGEKLMTLPPREAIPGMAEVVVMETLKAFVLGDTKPKTVDEHLRVLRTMAVIARIEVTELPVDNEDTKEARLEALRHLRERAERAKEDAATGIRAVEAMAAADEGAA